jgi:orotate phosphoribosyltransferase
MSTVQHLRPRLASDDFHGELLEIIRTRSFRQGHFKLASGAESTRYFNLKPTMMSPRGAFLAARAFLDCIEREGVDFVGGLEMGAVPIIGALAAVSEIEARPVRTFFVRKALKEHGTREKVEGLAPTESLSGAAVMVVDDVATTGGSIMKAIDTARGEGATVEVALVLVDREEGAAEALAEHGVRLISIFRGSEFG